MDSAPHPLSLSGQEECIMDTSTSSLSLAGIEKETPTMMGHAIMMNHYNSSSEDKKTRMHEEALKNNPRASVQELIEVKRTVLWKAIHREQKRKSQDEKDTSSSTLASSGTVKPASSLSMQAQPKSDEPPTLVNPHALVLTKEEKKAVFEATKLANPNVDYTTFNMALGVAVWKADNQKRGVNPGSSLDAVDISLL